MDTHCARTRTQLATLHFLHVHAYLRISILTSVRPRSNIAKKKKNWIAPICSRKKSDDHKTMEKYCGHNNRYPLSWEGAHVNRSAVASNAPSQCRTTEPINGYVFRAFRWCWLSLSSTRKRIFCRVESYVLFSFCHEHRGHRFERREALWFLAHPHTHAADKIILCTWLKQRIKLNYAYIFRIRTSQMSTITQLLRAAHTIHTVHTPAIHSRGMRTLRVCVCVCGLVSAWRVCVSS